MPRKNRPNFVALTKRLSQTHPNLDDPVAAIRAGTVQVNGVIVTEPTSRVPADAAVRLRGVPRPRGRLKLVAALEAFDVAIAGRIAADIGASTGGFTLALLAAGARKVYAVDTGHGQLLGSLRLDPRVINLEGVNLGQLSRKLVPDAVGVIAVDLSYPRPGRGGTAAGGPEHCRRCRAFGVGEADVRVRFGYAAGQPSRSGQGG